MTFHYVKTIDAETEQSNTFILSFGKSPAVGAAICCNQRTLRVLFAHQFSGSAQDIFVQEKECTSDVRTVCAIQNAASVFQEEGEQIIQKMGLPSSEAITIALLEDDDVTIDMPRVFLHAAFQDPSASVACSKEEMCEIIDVALARGMHTSVKNLLQIMKRDAILN